MSLSSHQSAKSKTFDWLTPPEWIRALGPFDLDPCASVNQPWPTAKVMLTSGGLEADWHGKFVWLNPPYGPPKVINPWMAKLADSRGGIACIPARTETRMWFESVWTRADLILFVKGRPHFHYPVSGDRAKANSGAPIALIAYGNVARQRIHLADIEGWKVDP